MSKYIEIYDLSLIIPTIYQVEKGCVDFGDKYLITSEDSTFFYFKAKNDKGYKYPKKGKLYSIFNYPLVRLVKIIYYQGESTGIVLSEDSNLFDTVLLKERGYNYVDIDYLSIKEEFVEA